MLYTDPLFICFFALVWLVTRIFRSAPSIREWWLIACSLFVIASWGLIDLTIFLGVLSINYALTCVLIRSSSLTRKILLWLIIGFDLAVLCLFKYFNFFGGAIGAFLGHALPHFPLGIPLAISFYTFHLISYIVDIYKGKIQNTSFRHYLFYLSFFPHVIAGPIVRAWQLVPQIGRIRHVKTDAMIGVHYVVTGFFFKAIIANNIAEVIDPFWIGQAGFELTMCDRWATAFLYYCEIYSDFAGYTLMALGMARLLGYRLPPNFRSPMLACTLQEFWQRWHITLSRWLRDYLYFPLGGSRVAAWRIGLNVMITMVLGGLWHGAGWGFIIWGAMQGLGIIAERLVGLRHFRWRIVGWGITQLWVLLAWVFFRAPNVNDAFQFVGNMFAFGAKWYSLNPLIFSTLCFAIPVILHHCFPFLMKWVGHQRLPLIMGIMTGVLLILDIIVKSPAKVFIYFKF